MTEDECHGIRDDLNPLSRLLNWDLMNESRLLEEGTTLYRHVCRKHHGECQCADWRPLSELVDMPNSVERKRCHNTTA